MIRFLAFVLLLASAAAQPKERIRLGTWNLEFFGNRRDHPRTDDDVDKVAGFVRELGVDVLAVQEVGTLEALQQLALRIGKDWQLVLGTTGMWRDGTGGQRVGFLWNDARVELLHAEEFLDLPRESDDPQAGKLPIFHRIPVSAVFRARNGGLDFRAITVHLKADNRRDIDQHMRDEMSTRKRVAEMAALGAEIGRLLRTDGEDRDIVVLGDFNHVLARERSTPSAAEAKVPFDLRVPLLDKLPGFVRLAPAKPQPTIRWFPESIDHVLVSADLQQEAVATSVAVHGPYAQGEPAPAVLDAWQKTFSDHFPLVFDLDATRDNDPAATFVPAASAHELRPGGWAAATAAPSTGARVPTTPAAGLLPPLRVGDHVQVRLINDRVFEGTLISPLGADWIQVDLDVGYQVAFPVRNVLYVQVK